MIYKLDLIAGMQFCLQVSHSVIIVIFIEKTAKYHNNNYQIGMNILVYFHKHTK